MGQCLMCLEKWRYGFTSVKGTSHEATNTNCQDSSVCTILEDKQGKKILVAVISDGAGSAKVSEIGSSLVCSLFVDEIRAYLETGNEIRDLGREFYEEWILRVHSEIDIRAEAMQLSKRDFACTFLSAVLTDEIGFFAQIGDGAIVMNSPEEPDTYNWEFWPQQGEYENTTYFITENNAIQKLMFSPRQGKACTEIAMFTDGIQRLVLHYESRTVHSPFLQPFFKILRNQDESSTERYTSSLAAFLNSDKVNERTDDDKTLLLATRLANTAV